jgi:4-methyl-5(b-hydroxyethyl)-thiazole monophosphate biosynthesis
VLLAAGFEEIEAITVIDVLRRAEVEVVVIAVEAVGPDLSVRGSRGVQVVADAPLDAATGGTWDAVILPGGLPGARTLRDHLGAQALIRAQHQAGRALAAICAAPIALGKAGVLQGRKATCYPGVERELTGAQLQTEAVVKDGHLTTSRGPGTAMAFALSLVADLASPEKAATLKQQMLV